MCYRKRVARIAPPAHPRESEVCVSGTSCVHEAGGVGEASRVAGARVQSRVTLTSMTATTVIDVSVTAKMLGTT